MFIVLAGINLLLHLAAFIPVGTLQESSEIDLSNIPSRYNFLMFPAGTAAIYKTEKFLTSEKVGVLARAVGGEYQEIKNGSVGVMDEGFVRVSDLRYLPEGDPEKYVKDWQDKIASSGYYTAGNWGVKDLANGHKQVALELRDDKHARSHTYSYETDGNKLFSITPVKVASGVAMGAVFLMIISFLFSTSIIWTIAGVVFKS